MQAHKYLLNLTRFTIIIVLSLFAHFLYADSQEDFNTICDIFTEAQNSSFTDEEIGRYIESNIKSRVSNEDAITAYSLIYVVDKDVRYSNFKKSAEYSTGKEWSCNVMKQLINK